MRCERESGPIVEAELCYEQSAYEESKQSQIDNANFGTSSYTPSTQYQRKCSVFETDHNTALLVMESDEDEMGDTVDEVVDGVAAGVAMTRSKR